jgi:hypothetical protein
MSIRSSPYKSKISPVAKISELNFFCDLYTVDRTALNIKMATASFTTPSPNNTELSFGYLFSGSNDNAAIVSVAHKTLAY